ncbi:MAG: hypothetical protein M1165_02330 [Candidatus Pacearchaeota archaeon]|nr:hypothetical protein [Candidatus Pacearchaeota archaeon]MDE1848985.1 sulfite exporter TauE/SafE family protein [Nanoarchaeota archaeon]
MIDTSITALALKITPLALADSVNPCAFAVLTMVLISILINNPGKKRKVLFGGLAFTLAVFIGYLFYGLILTQFFSAFSALLRTNAIYFYDALAIISMIIGVLNIKEFFNYKRGEFATEMPMSFRPRLKRIIERVTSPGGAFIIGFIVTLFLLPCTIGPYIVASGLLSQLGLFGAIPWLMYYDLIFILPMLVIVGLICWGLTKVEDVSKWKDRNIKVLHLIAGILLFLVGIAILIGWL